MFVWLYVVYTVYITYMVLIGIVGTGGLEIEVIDYFSVGI